MLFITYGDQNTINRAIEKKAKYKESRIWKKALGYEPFIAMGAEDAKDLWISAMLDVNPLPQGVMLYTASEYIRVNRFKLAGLIREKEEVLPSDFLSCRDDNADDISSIFLVKKPEEIFAHFPCAGFTLASEEMLPNCMQMYLGDHTYKICDIINTNIKNLNERLMVTQLPDNINEEQKAVWTAIMRGRDLFNFAVLPFLANLFLPAVDQLKSGDIKVSADLSCLYSGCLCTNKAQQLLNEYYDWHFTGEGNLEDILDQFKDTYIAEQEVIDAFVKHEVPQANELCPCGCGQKWKRHYGKVLDSSAKRMFPDIVEPKIRIFGAPDISEFLKDGWTIH